DDARRTRSAASYSRGVSGNARTQAHAGAGVPAVQPRTCLLRESASDARQRRRPANRRPHVSPRSRRKAPRLILRRRPGRSSRSSAERRDYWSLTAPELLVAVAADPQGLSGTEAARRLQQHGPNTLRAQQSLSRLRLLGSQLRSPLLLLLVFAAVASAATREWIDSGIVLSVVFATLAIGYSREYGAQQAVEALRDRVRTRAQALRDGRAQAVAVEGLVPG